jgi:uncharacterized phage protein gp47/JayE
MLFLRKRFFLQPLHRLDKITIGYGDDQINGIKVFLTIVARVFGRVLAGLAHGLYGYIDWASLQILPDTQDEDILLRYGAIFGVTRTEGAYATGTVTATGTDGSLIPADTLWQR